jgi:hypothetical protein
MNPRIKELWNEAAESTVNDSWESQTKFIERFAELLEQEFFSAGYQAGRSDGIRETALECIDIFGQDLPEPGDARMTEVVDRICRVAEHFAVK